MENMQIHSLFVASCMAEHVAKRGYGPRSGKTPMLNHGWSTGTIHDSQFKVKSANVFLKTRSEPLAKCQFKTVHPLTQQLQFQAQSHVRQTCIWISCKYAMSYSLRSLSVLAAVTASHVQPKAVCNMMHTRQSDDHLVSITHLSSRANMCQCTDVWFAHVHKQKMI